MIKSVEQPIENEIVINKSRFIGILVHVESEEEVKEYLELYKEIYPNATHYCYAYIIDNHKKASDDGEPSKTAGMPMLNVLEKQELNQILCIVVRYFGGVKLGAGGLVRAYSQSVSEALLQANIVVYNKQNLYEITFDYSFIRLIDYYIKNMKIIVKDKRYDEKVSYLVYLKDESLFDAIQEATSNQYSKKFIKEEYIKETEDL